MLNIRQTVRRVVDRLQYTPRKGTIKLGESAFWHVDATKLVSESKPILFSGGAGNDISFELAFIEKFGGNVFLYDPSPTGQSTVQKQTVCNELTFIPKALNGQAGILSMDKPVNGKEGSWTITGVNSSSEKDTFEAVSVVDEIRRLGYDRVDILKLDIEGFEYSVLRDVLDSNITVQQILVEFHDFFPNIDRTQSLNAIALLKRKGYVCFHKQRYDFCFAKK